MSFTSFLYCSVQNRVIELYLWKPPGICVLFDVLTCLWQRNQTRNGSLRSLIIVLLLFYFGLICGKMTKGVWLSSSYFGFALAACVLSFFSMRELAQILDHFIFDLGFVFSHPAVFAILLSGLCAFLCLSVLLPFLSFEHISLSTYNRLVSGWCLILGFLATSFKTLPLLSVGLLALEFVSFSSAGFRAKSAQLAGECWEVGQRVDVGVSVRVRKWRNISQEQRLCLVNPALRVHCLRTAACGDSFLSYTSSTLASFWVILVSVFHLTFWHLKQFFAVGLVFIEHC